MFENLRQNWQSFLEAPPGKRFRRRYRARKKQNHGLLSRALFVGGGVLVTAAGIFFLPAPGPGTVIIFVGLGLIAQESLWMSMVLDKTELYLREMYDWIKEKWDSTSLITKIIISLIIVIISAGAAYGLYWLFWS